MNFLPIFVLFALVNVLMACELEEEYKKQVYITNEYIRRAVSSNRLLMYRTAHLMTVVKNIVLEEHTMVEMALMLVVPEKQDLVVIEQETQEGSGDDETTTLLAVPETQEVLAIKHHKLLWYQKKLQAVIKDVIDIYGEPAINQVSLSRTNLKYLGSERRYLTGAAVSELIHAIVVRQIPTMRSAFSDFSNMCRLLGLHRSLKNVFLKLPIIESANVHDGTCILEDSSKSKTKYRDIEGIIWQLNDDGTQFQLLSYQVE